MKKELGRSKDGQIVPDCLEGATTEDDILEKFRTVYCDLYNSCDTSHEMNTIKEKLKSMIGGQCMYEVNKISGRVVKEACLKLKPGKGDVSGSFTSDVLLNAPDLLFEHLAAVFRSYMVHGTVSLQLLSCAFLPLFKCGLKDPEKADSYRAIAASSQLLKLFDNVVLLLWGDMLGSDSLPPVWV